MNSSTPDRKRPATKSEAKAAVKAVAKTKLAEKEKAKVQVKAPEPSVLFENKHILILNKPAGLVVHSDGKTEEPTLCDWIVRHYPKTKGVGEPGKAANGAIIDRPGIVHRLDRETSGVIVIAKTQDSFEELKKQFQEREVKKLYNTIVWGLVKDDKGTIDRPIGRSKTDFRKWSAGRFARGELRTAVTEYEVLARKENPADYRLLGKIPEEFTFLQIYPKTGRTHQIRVHFKAIHHPVVGDDLYAENHPNALGFKRLALHARYIKIEDLDGKVIEAEAPLPADFMAALKVFEA